MIEVKNVTGGYAAKEILTDITLDVKKGEFFGIIGPNGSGKTTLLKMMSGILTHFTGDIVLKGQPISAYTAKDFAKLMAVLPQQTAHTFSYTVKQTVAMGRYAHQTGFFHSYTEKDERVVQKVMEQTGIAAYEDALLDQLSGGERQRVYLAQALAQSPEILVLDEPTNHLDLAYQKDLLDLLKKWTESNQLTVISIFHDLNLAGLYCDRLLMLDDGRKKVCDTPDEVLKKPMVQDVYHTTIEKFPHPKVPKPQIMLVPEKIPLQEKQEMIQPNLLHVNGEMIRLQAPMSLKTMSSGVTGSGVGWYRTFVNRHVDENYKCDDYIQEMTDYLTANGFDPNETVGMMTAVQLEQVASLFLEKDGLSVFIVVTAGIGNAVDAANGAAHVDAFVPGTINTWVFINGKLTDEAYIQSIMTATEAKTKALHEQKVRDRLSNTFATGTSTDSILIAATQSGKVLSFGGTISPLGQLVGKGVYDCTVKALHHYFAGDGNI